MSTTRPALPDRSVIGTYRRREHLGTPTGAREPLPVGTSQIAPPPDLSGLGSWHDEIVAAGIAEDQERYRKAVRGYVQAGLRAFDLARKGVA